MIKNAIKNPSIAIKPSAKLIDFIKTLDDTTIDLPENLLEVYESFTQDARARKLFEQSIPISKYSDEENKLLEELHSNKTQDIDIEKCLQSLSLKFVDEEDENSSSDIESLPIDEANPTKTISKNKARQNRAKQRQKQLSKLTLNLNDLKWLHRYLLEKRKSDPTTCYLHELIDESQLILPKNELIPRNPVLEERIQRLKRQQDERNYRAMTKNVDCTRSNIPEDTIAFQMKQINRHLIAVLQFIFSVAAGFAFGFIGVELIIGDLDFGFRLLLGVICALVIALAEIYFLAKKLNEEFDVPDSSNQHQQSSTFATNDRSVANKKQHAD